MVFRNPVMLCFFALIVGLFGLIQVKMYVQELSNDITQKQNNKDELVSEIRILHAEWTYLNNASRLEKLAKEHLHISKDNLVYHISDLDGGSKAEIVKQDELPIKKISWRYKSRDQILNKVKGLKNIGSHGIVKVSAN